MGRRLAVMKANSAGALKSQLPMNATGPTGEDINPGDTVTFSIVRVEKQGDDGE